MEGNEVNQWKESVVFFFVGGFWVGDKLMGSQ